jgi:hypothetical protein
MKTRFTSRRMGRAVGACAVALALAGAPALFGAGQNSPDTPTKRDTLLMPQANHLPDVNDQMMMRIQKQGKQNFDAANALRHKQIGDDVQKLLILATDLQKQMSQLGSHPVPDKLLREAAVIELLAHDVETRMTLTVPTE